MDNNVRFPAEWEPQAAILIAWPNADTDWAERLAEVEETYIALVAAIVRFQRVLICVADDDVETYAEMRLRSNRIDMERVRFVTVPGTEGHESALEIDSEEGTTLVVNDLVWNVENRPGIGGFVFRLMGATGPDPKIPKVVQLGAIKDKPALKAQLEAWASLPRLLRILPSHGSTITDDPPGTLRRLAAELG